MSFSKDSKQKLSAIGAVVIVALLGVTAFLLYNNYNQDMVIDSQKTELLETEQLKAELEKQYYESLSELEEMRGNNDELNALIDQQKAELAEQKDKIARSIRSGKASKRDLADARNQIAQMRVQLDGYVSENQKLQEEKEILTQANAQLTTEKQGLETEVASQRVMNEEHVTARAALVSQKEELENVNSDLSAKVSIASVVKIQSIKGEGYKIRKSGKAVRKKRASSVDRVKVCFTALSNEVVEEGVEKFYIRIIGPTGETLAVEDLGSGILTSTVSGEEIRYTKVKEIDYNNGEVEACMLWQPNTEFSKGNYEVEIFNKGFVAGKGTFSLK